MCLVLRNTELDRNALPMQYIYIHKQSDLSNNARKEFDLKWTGLNNNQIEALDK